MKIGIAAGLVMLLTVTATLLIFGSQGTDKVQADVVLSKEESMELEIAGKNELLTMQAIEILANQYNQKQQDLNRLKSESATVLATICKSHGINPEEYVLSGDFKKLAKKPK